MGQILQGLPGSAHQLMGIMQETLIKYEPRLATVNIELLEQTLPGHLEYSLDVLLNSGRQITFGTTVAPEGKVLVRHLKRQQWLR
ncbi:hypothetical protein D3C85_1060520 [compost metagenome]